GAYPKHPSRSGHLASGVPGVLAGQVRALVLYGTMPLERVIQPAIRLAEEGFPVDTHYCENASETMERYEESPGLKSSCSFVYHRYLDDGRLLRPGDRLVQPELGGLLRAIARHGPEYFYGGPVAEAIEQVSAANGGILTRQDMAGYEVIDRAPIRTTYRSYELITMPPPSSGGIALAEALNILEAAGFADVAQSEPGRALHLQIEAMKHAFADRARWLGDCDYVEVPIDLLVSKSYARRLAAGLSAERTQTLSTYGIAELPEDGGTSHFCVVDRWGNVVVATETINTAFGSLVAVPPWGLVLNNQMDDFAAEPGAANAYGLVESDRNAVQPGKRPLSSMSPTIVMQDGAPYLLLGGSGGPRIISSVLNVLLGVTDRGQSLEAAMLARRPHHQWRPDEVFFDEAPAPGVRQSLEARGHQLSDQRRTGIVQAIRRTPGGWLGASDPRKGGRPAGR
ncbi:MAG: gamma-glutamyltransferase, partial [bacterium]